MQPAANTFWRCSTTGRRWRNCGASDEQEQLAAEQAQFYDDLRDAFGMTFPEQQAILKSLTEAFTPILAAGPNQEGFSPELEASLRTRATDLTAESAQQAAVALGGKLATLGDAAIPSGAKLQLETGLLDSAARENARQQLQITEDDYTAGRENFLAAADRLGNAAGLQNPTGFAGVANQGGSAAAQTYDDIAAANNAWMGPVFGAIGGLGGGLLGA